MSKKPVIGLVPYDHENGDRYMPEGYLKGVEIMGCEPYIFDYVNWDRDEVAKIADTLDGMIFTGGVDVDPALYGEEKWPETGRQLYERDSLEKFLFERLYPRKVPILCICRGLQIINAVMGGSLVQDVPKVYGTVHQQDSGDPPFRHEAIMVPGSKVSEIFGTDRIMVNTYHHQCANRIAEGLVVTAKAPDGVPEALEGTGDSFLVCLQWHPEKTLGIDEYSVMPFMALRKAVDEFIGIK